MTPARSFWQRHRWLVLRRLSQLSVLGLFAGSGALAGWLGGASMAKGAARVLFWGALAMGATALIGRAFGTGIA